jgi:hypothetical protein
MSLFPLEPSGTSIPLEMKGENSFTECLLPENWCYIVYLFANSRGRTQEQIEKWIGYRAHVDSKDLIPLQVVVQQEEES